MNEEEKSQLEHIKDDLVKIATDLAMDEKRPPEERISLLMAKIRTEPDIEAFHAAKQAIEEIEDSDLKLKATTDLIEEIEVARGNVRTGDSNSDRQEQPQPELEEGGEHLIPAPEHQEPSDEHHEHQG